MICDECQKEYDEIIYISYNTYCKLCAKKYELVKCPIDTCDNIISLNNYETYDTDNSTCDMCNTLVCTNCITRDRTNRICYDCINDTHNDDLYD